MKLTYSIAISFMVVLFFSACEEAVNNHVDHRLKDKNLKSIDFNDTLYDSMLSSVAKDTITTDGWSINYKVKDDSSCYNDLYIEWSKGKTTGVYKCNSVLQYKTYFVPTLIAESDHFIFLYHACAINCSALLVLSKDSVWSRDFARLVAFNSEYSQVVTLSDKLDSDIPFALIASDLKRDKDYLIQFKNLCMPVSNKEWNCMDTVIFSQEQIIVKTRLTLNDYDRDKEVIETATVSLR